jgi:hypothetical protein
MLKQMKKRKCIFVAGFCEQYVVAFLTPNLIYFAYFPFEKVKEGLQDHLALGLCIPH